MGDIYLITGSDEFAVKNKAAELIRSICGNNPEENQALEIVRGDADGKKSDEIMRELAQSVDTPPFLSPNKIIWLKHYIHFDGGTQKDTAALEILTSIIKSGIPDDLTLIIDGTGVDRRKSFYKEADKKGVKISFIEKAELGSKNYTSGIIQKIKDIFAASGKYPEPAALNYLGDSLRGDSGIIINEIEKIICYVGDRENVTLDDCRELASPTPEALSWAFAEALTERNTLKALDTISIMIEQMRRERGNYNYELTILGQASRVFQEMVRTKAAAQELGAPKRCDKSYFYNISDSIKEQFKGNFLLGLNPYRAFMLCQSASRFSDEELSGALSTILETNKTLVSGGGNSRVALEQLVLKINPVQRRNIQ